MTAARVGRFTVDRAAPLEDIPALVPVIGAGHLFVRGDGAERNRSLVGTIVTRLLLTSPPSMVRLTLIDPVTAGAALAAFLRLPTLVRGDGIAVRPEDVDGQLQSIETHIAEVNQQRLTNVYPDIEAYNAGVSAVRIPYRLVVFTDFPGGFEERTFKRLLSIASNGPRAGVYAVGCIDSEQEVPRGVDIDELLSTGTVLDVSPGIVSPSELLLAAESDLPGQVTSFGTTALSIPGMQGRQSVALDLPLDSARANAWLEAHGTAAMEAATSLPFSRFAIPSTDRWHGGTSNGLSVVVGATGSGEPWHLEIGRSGSTVHHGLIVGMPGSGKSNLLHVLITQLALRYSPEELELYLLDFREGVGFQPYSALPHVRALALESEREFALSILLHLQDAMIERGRLYKGLSGGTVDQFPDYRRQSGETLPRMLLVMDEFQVLFRDDDRLALDAERALTDLAKRGRGFGINMLLCSQSLNLATRSGSQVYNMMDLRIALRCAASDSAVAIGNEAASALERPGDALLNLMPGTHRVANLPVDERRRFLGEAASLLAGKSYPPAVTFESQAPADIRDNVELSALIAASEWPAADGVVRIWLGEPVSLSAPVKARLERYMRMNLLVAGGSDAEAYGLLAATLVSLAAQRRPGAAEFVVADFARPGSPGHGLLARLADHLPHNVQIVGPRDAASLLEDLTRRLAERIEGEEGTELYVIVAGIHRWRELRSSDPYSPSEASLTLTRLAEEGPEVGIHLIVWADGAAAIDRTLKRGAASYFDHRVVLRVVEKDSQDLLGTNSAARLEDNRAFYRNEDDELGSMMKLKPYSLLDKASESEWLDELKER